MGLIVYWTIIRTAIVIAAMWLLKPQIDEQLWYIITVAISYGIIIHPAIAGFRKFEEKNKNVIAKTKFPVFIIFFSLKYIVVCGISYSPYKIFKLHIYLL